MLPAWPAILAGTRSRWESQCVAVVLATLGALLIELASVFVVLLVSLFKEVVGEVFGCIGIDRQLFGCFSE